MTQLAMGANAALAGNLISLGIALPSGATIDVTTLLLYDTGKVRGDDDMCLYGQPSVAGGAVALSGGAANPRFAYNLSRLPNGVEKLVVTATVDGSANFGSLAPFTVNVENGPTLPIETKGRSEAALILAEIYLRNGQWKIRHVAQGFNGGLKALAEHFGVDISDDAARRPAAGAAPPPPPTAGSSPAPVATPAAASGSAPEPATTVNISKVNLTKEKKTVSLTKKDGKYGKIGINLNWTQKPRKSGFLGLGGSGNVDLDLGAFVELSDGRKFGVQALGDQFGDYSREPYVKLLGDDRTGEATEGEWLQINGDKWSEIRRIMIFCFIYDGAANWRETDGYVTLHAPGQPEVEVRLNEYGSRDMFCAIAEIRNQGGEVAVERLVEFYLSHREADLAHGWGFEWVAGSKD